jgi:hypothetical protein
MTGQESGPADPVTVLAAGAAQAHELFTAWVDAGFTDRQALYLLGQVMAASAAAARGPAEPPP